MNSKMIRVTTDVQMVVTYVHEYSQSIRMCMLVVTLYDLRMEAITSGTTAVFAGIFICTDMRFAKRKG